MRRWAVAWLLIWTMGLAGWQAWTWWRTRPLGSPTTDLVVELDKASAPSGAVISARTRFTKTRACPGSVQWIARQAGAPYDEFMLRPVYSAMRPAVGPQVSEVRLYLDIPPGAYSIGPVVLYNCTDGDYFAEGPNREPIEWVQLEVIESP